MTQTLHSQLLPAPNLDFYLESVSRRVGFANTVQVQHPAELSVFEGLSHNELKAAATRHNLQLVSRLGGRELDFTRLSKAL